VITAQFKTANLPQLVRILNHEADAISTIYAKMDLIASTGGQKSGTVTDYHDVTAYLMVRKPADIRLLGQVAILGTLFDMASDGSQFELNVPVRSKCYQGRNEVIPAHVANPLERLRPQVILQALLVNPIPADNHVVAMNDDAETRGEYDVLVETPGSRVDDLNVDHVIRKIIFSRIDLQPREQLIYDGEGNVATIAFYSKFQTVNNVPIPYDLVISRPSEEYTIHMTMQQVKINTLLTNDKFVIALPAGSKCIQISRGGQSASGNLSMKGRYTRSTTVANALARP
jgi:hypothetical protein